MKFQSAGAGELGAGIDSISPENRIPDGFSEFLKNFDPTPEDSLRKRLGYSLYSGGLPVRVEAIDYQGSQINFYLDSSINISSIDLSKERSSPLLVFGRTLNPHADGDFTNEDRLVWYPGFTSDPKLRFQPGTNTLVLTGDTHGAGPILSVGTAVSTTTTDNSNYSILPDEVTVDAVTADVSITYTNGTGSTLPVFVYTKSRAVTPGSSYAETFAVPAGDSTYSIPAMTHGLSNFNILTEVYDSTGGSSLTRVLPDEVLLAPDGSVTFGFSSVATAFTATVIVYNVPVTQKMVGSAAPFTTTTLSVTGLTTPFLFTGIYLEDTVTGILSAVIPDSIAVDDVLHTAAVTFTNQGGSSNFVVYYDTGIVTSNRLTVEGNAVTTPYLQETVQLSIWGLLHRDIYASYSASTRPGWVTHLDNYRSELEERLVSGLGGNLFASYSQTEVGNTYGLPTYYPALNERVLAETTVSPAFREGASARSRGYISFIGGGEGWATVSSVTYVNADYVDYELTCPSLTVSGTLPAIIQNTDLLSVENCGFAQNNGTFPVFSVTAGVDTLVVRVRSSSVQDSSDWNETGAFGQAGVFTDLLPLSSFSPFIPNDTLLSDLWDDGTNYVVTSSDNSSVSFSGVFEELTVPTGLRVVASRRGRVLPMRTLLGDRQVTNLVKGDSLLYSEYTRRLRVTHVTSTPDTQVFIYSDGTTATATMQTGSTLNLAVGQTALILRGFTFTGEHLVTSILSDTQFTFASTLVDNSYATLAGLTLEVDEVLPFKDTVNSSTQFTVERRWIPIEAPDSALPFPQLHYRYFTKDNFASQSFLRSVISKDSLFLSNGRDAIYKFEGSSLYRAGLPRVQLLTYLTTDTTAPARVEISNPNVTSTAVTNNVVTVAYGSELRFTAGDTVRYTYTGGYADYLVERVYQVDTTGLSAGYVVLQSYGDLPTGGTPTLRLLSLYRYYGRLNAIDVNGNVVASAVAGAEDYRVTLPESAAIYHKLTVPPIWDTYDFDRIEAQLYRTKENQVAPFYSITSLQVPFGTRYVLFTDTRSDDTLTDLDLVNSALLGAELGQTFSHPLNAKCITSAANRLILGNVRSWPYLSLLIGDSGKRIDATALNTLRFLFRKDDTDVLTTSNVTDRIGLELRTAGAVSFTPAVTVVAPGGAATITAANTLAVGDWVYLFHSVIADGNQLALAGYYQVTAATGTTFVVQTGLPTYTTSALDVDRVLPATLSGDLPVWIGLDGNYATLDGNVVTGLSAQNVAVKRMADAISASQATIQNPWVLPNAGGEYKYGELFLDFSKVLATTPEVLLPAYLQTDFYLFVNDVLRPSLGQASAISQLFPSRLLISLPSYPEMFDAPTASLDTDSLSAIDVNREDGQEITAVIPFFGESAFGAAQKDGIILVFKANSIYVVNVAAKAAGQPCVQRLDSRGLGCTSPYSVAPTQNGVMFVNSSGIYRVRSDLSVQFIGRRLQRSWKLVDEQQSELTFGHYSALENKYKVTVGFKEDSSLPYPKHAFVYDTTREYSADGYRDGSWTSYDEVPSLGWSNSLQSSFFASPFGEVFGQRNAGDTTDYRDDGAAIKAEATLRALDFGDSSIRKSIGSIVCQFRTEYDSTASQLYSTVDFRDNFQLLDSYSVVQQPYPNNGLSGVGGKKIQSVRFTAVTTKGVYIQLKLVNEAIDEQVELTSVTFRIGGLNERGISEAADGPGK